MLVQIIEEDPFVPTGFPGFPEEMRKFFRGLKRNNDREWFQPRKEQFEQYVKQPMAELVAAVNVELEKFAPNFVTDPKKAIFRIYRDTRFSNDKTPYKTHIAASFRPRGVAEGAGMYVHLSDSDVFAGGGIYHPDPEMLRLLRGHIAQNHERLRKILADRKVKTVLGELHGSELTRVPKGFDPEHPAADLIRKKDLLLGGEMDAGLTTTPRFLPEFVARFKAMNPFLEFLNQPLAGRKAAREPMEIR